MHLKRLSLASAVMLLAGFSSLAQTNRAGLAVDDLVRTALERNQEYLAARERMVEQAALARQAGLRPMPAFEIEGATGAVLGSSGESEYSAAYFHTIESGGKRGKRIAIAEKGLALAEAELAEHRRQLTFDIKRRLIAAQEAELKLASIRSMTPATEQNYQLTVNRVELGDAAPLEQQLLLTEMNRARAEQTSLLAAAQAARVELRSVIGLASAEAVELPTAMPFGTDDFTLERLQQLAGRQRPDLRTLILLEEQAAAETNLVRAESQPDVTVFAGYTRSTSRFDQFGFSESGAIVPLRDTDNVLTFGLSIPLFTRKRGQAAIDVGLSREAQQRMRREYLARTIPLEVEAAYWRWQGAVQALDILRTGVIEPSQRNLTVIREAYRLGELRLLDVLNEQRRLVEFQLSFAGAQAEAARAFIEMERAVGGNLP